MGSFFIAGVFMYREGTIKSNVNNKIISSPSPNPTEEPQLSPSASSSPSAIPAPETIDISKYKIEVLNGSGISGEAAKVNKQLETEKLTVSSIGNADSLSNQKTNIQAKKTVPKEFLEKLKSFLEKEYILDDIKELSDNEKSDVVVIVGNKKVE